MDGMQAARQDHRRLSPSRAPSFRLAAGEAPAPSVPDVRGGREDMHIYICIGEGNGTPLLYSCLENPMDGGGW